MTEPTTVDTSAAAIAAVLEGVTPGPWTDEPDNIDDAEDYSVDREDDNESGLCWSGVGNSVSTVALVVVPSSFGMDEEQAANARFIAWCREGVPALSAQLTAETARADAAEADAAAAWDKCEERRLQAVAAEAARDALREALEEGRRAIGDHYAPTDCYATGPLTGDHFRDLVQCPACSFIAQYDAVTATEGKPL